MGWFALVIAIVLEILGTIAAKQSNGFTNLAASVLMVYCYVLSFTGLAIAMKTIEMSVAYPMWTGISILMVSFLGMALLNESTNPIKAISLFLLTVGIVGLTAGSQLHS
jgi:small multidrug resistance pump